MTHHPKPCVACGKPRPRGIGLGRRWCDDCRDRARRGDYTPEIAAMVKARLAKHASPVEGSACVRWTGPHNDRGYGLITFAGICQRVHRLAYQAERGRIPDGMTIDHVRARGCRYRDCLVVDHMEVVTMAENNSRERKPYCRKGHLLAEHAWPHGGCRTCHLAASAERVDCPICGKRMSRGNLRRHQRQMHGLAEVAA